MNKVLILGGTGFVGRSLCALIAGSDSATEITVPSRRPVQARQWGLPPSARIVGADVHDAAQLAGLVDGQDAVVNLIAILHGSDADFVRTHVALPRTLVGACRSKGVRRIVHVSALGVDSAQPSCYLRSKAEGEAVLQGADLDVTLLRPSVIYGRHDRFMNLFARLSRFAPVLPLASADARFQPVWVEDVARAILVCLERPGTAGQIFECTGPEIFTLRELVKLAGRWSGHERSVIALPPALGMLQAAVMERMPGETLMSGDNLQSMKTPNVASGTLPSLEDLGIRAAALDTVAPKYLGAGHAQS
ncbi:complex I NDUFA9 subunit family protein [Variovorax sp. J22R24]|uniref:complex I NDUFA9 subunit family protein n=1 Tax=Variovorax gracilis TaxID=3053502 RepID=UPI002575970C|nr:complex I NDUFA9 subunit family protein [Variovorax sp. J22R24]MDM0105941.1 complex I NDUFA9 subunit family protein [Variovorax sp. J22R24]